MADLPTVTASGDPNHDHLLALASAGSADFLVTGEKRDLLSLVRFERTRILTLRHFLDVLEQRPNDRGPRE